MYISEIWEEPAWFQGARIRGVLSFYWFLIRSKRISFLKRVLVSASLQSSVCIHVICCCFFSGGMPQPSSCQWHGRPVRLAEVRPLLPDGASKDGVEGKHVRPYLRWRILFVSVALLWSWNGLVVSLCVCLCVCVFWKVKPKLRHPAAVLL